MTVSSHSRGKYLPLTSHASKGVDALTRMRHITAGMRVVPCAPVATRRFSTLRNIQCLRRILPCAWSTRHRTCFPIRRAPCFVSSRATSRQRCAASGPVPRSEPVRSSFAIRASGFSVNADFQLRAPPSIASATMRGSGPFRSLLLRRARPLTGRPSGGRTRAVPLRCISPHLWMATMADIFRGYLVRALREMMKWRQRDR
jgi:hypothetical protein